MKLCYELHAPNRSGCDSDRCRPVPIEMSNICKAQTNGLLNECINKLHSCFQSSCLLDNLINQTFVNSFKFSIDSFKLAKYYADLIFFSADAKRRKTFRSKIGKAVPDVIYADTVHTAYRCQSNETA